MLNYIQYKLKQRQVTQLSEDEDAIEETVERYGAAAPPMLLEEMNLIHNEHTQAISDMLYYRRKSKIIQIQTFFKNLYDQLF